MQRRLRLRASALLDNQRHEYSEIGDSRLESTVECRFRALSLTDTSAYEWKKHLLRIAPHTLIMMNHWIDDRVQWGARESGAVPRRVSRRARRRLAGQRARAPRRLVRPGGRAARALGARRRRAPLVALGARSRCARRRWLVTLRLTHISVLFSIHNKLSVYSRWLWIRL